MDTAFKKDYTINIYDVDSRHRCKFSSLINYFWDVIISQSDTLGETEEGLVHNSCVWVLLKYDIDIYEYPKFRDTINVDTVVEGYKKFYGYRSNTVRNTNGDKLAYATSTAILIDIDKRRPLKITPDQCEVYGLKEELENPPTLDDIPKVENIDISREYTIGYSDIDSNNHVNNLKYMEKSVDTLPTYILNDYDISNIKVLFKKETTIGNTICIDTQIVTLDNSIKTIHSIVSSEGKLLTKLQFTWKPSDEKNSF